MNPDLWCPFANHEPVVNHGGTMGCYSFRTRSLGVLEHVTAGYGDPDPWFNTPAAQASATFFIAKNGRLAQYMSATARAWAQMSGNDEYQSVETEGEPNEPLTDAQIETYARLYAWAHNQPELAWPLQEANANGQEGLGWHGMDPSFGHPFCPGEIRKAQRPAILARAAQLITGNAPTPVPTGEFTMDTEAKAAFATLTAANAALKAELDALRADVHSTFPYLQRTFSTTVNTASALATAQKSVDTVNARVAGVGSDVAALPAKFPQPPAVLPVDPVALQSALLAAMVRPEVAAAVLSAISLTGQVSLVQNPAVTPAPVAVAA